MKIKICGLTRPADIDAANAYRPNYIGFVFAPTRRFVSDEQAAALKARLDKSIPAVGVFVNEPQEHIDALCRAGTIDMVQLHGEEDADYIAALRRRLPDGIPIILAQKVQSTEQILAADALDVDYLLLDTYRKGVLGGTGESFCWELIPKKLRHPFFLAGGLDATNLTQAAAYAPDCLDVSSGAETDGHKDPEKMRELIAQTRRL